MASLFSNGNPTMNSLAGSVPCAPERLLRLPCRLLAAALLCLAAAISSASEQSTALQALSAERELVQAELTQIQKTIALLQGSTRSGADSGSTAVQGLNAEATVLKQRLIELSQREIALLEQQVSATAAPPPAPAEAAIESKPLPAGTPDYSVEAEAARVAQLQKLLKDYYSEEEESRQTMPTEAEVADREAARRDAVRLARIPFNTGKVRLSGAEGSTALAEISRRLADPNIPESRRDAAVLCSIRTHLFGNLIASERRSLTPVGKHHYMTRIELQPGDTTVRIQGYRWQVNLPDDIHTQAYLITLYKPPGATPEFHIFPVDELLAEEQAHIPAWLPEQLGIPRAG